MIHPATESADGSEQTAAGRYARQQQHAKYGRFGAADQESNGGLAFPAGRIPLNGY